MQMLYGPEIGTTGGPRTTIVCIGDQGPTQP